MSEEQTACRIGWVDLTVEDAPRVRDFYQSVVYSVIIAGFYAEDREIWVEMVGDKLERCSSYTP